jgi:hypothetical protein
MAANFYIVDPTPGAPAPVTQTGTVQVFPLGYVARGADYQTGSANAGAGQFVYMRGSNVTTVGQMVALSNGSAVLLGTVNSASLNNVGVAAGNLSATSVYGWVQIQGYCDYLKGGSTDVGAAGLGCYILASAAGYIQSARIQGNRISGIVFTNTFSSADTNMSVWLMYPKLLGSSVQFS